jgi:hypothetical protein
MYQACSSCANSYQGSDLVLRCRVSTNGLICSESLAEDCRRFEYEPGTDAEEVTVTLCDCMGRGD